MIVILSVVITFLWFKQKVTCQHFKNHTGARPYISTGVVWIANNCFRWSVLSSLDLWCKMMMSPASITHVYNCHMTFICQLRTSFRGWFNRLFFNFFTSLMVLGFLFDGLRVQTTQNFSPHLKVKPILLFFW